jgi:uncharacterized protein (TIGR03118 family)
MAASRLSDQPEDRLMKHAVCCLSATVVAAALSGIPIARADGPNAYVETKLVSNLPGAQVMDPNLQNPWGVAFSPSGSPFWIADNNSGLSTLYDGNGTIIPLVVTIPGPAGSPAGFVAAPDGMIWNPDSSIHVPNTSVSAEFIFDTEDGTISAWGGGLTPATQAVLAVDNSQGGTGAVYKGLAYGVNESGFFLFATNFRAGTVEVYDTGFNPATTSGGFQDPRIPADYAPYGIQNIDGNLWITYGKQNAVKHDSVKGPGAGFVDVFDTDGNLVQKFAQRGTLNSPWGVVRASQAFGKFSGDMLIGNFGDGRINVFSPDGTFLDQLDGKDGKPLTILKLWTLALGGGAGSNPDTLYFTAGPDAQTNGVFGTIAPAR